MLNSFRISGIERFKEGVYKTLIAVFSVFRKFFKPSHSTTFRTLFKTSKASNAQSLGELYCMNKQFIVIIANYEEPHQHAVPYSHRAINENSLNSNLLCKGVKKLEEYSPSSLRLVF